jgi:hypothetical protein
MVKNGTLQNGTVTKWYTTNTQTLWYVRYQYITVTSTHGSHVNPWIGWAFSLTSPNPGYGQSQSTEVQTHGLIGLVEFCLL